MVEKCPSHRNFLRYPLIYLKHFDPSYSYNNDINLDWNTFNNGIIQILKKTYPINKPSIKMDNKKPNSTNIHTKYRELQTDINYNIFKSNIIINNTHFVVNKLFSLPGKEYIIINNSYLQTTLEPFT